MLYRHIIGAERELASTFVDRALREVLNDFPECRDLNIAHYLLGDVPYVTGILVHSFTKSQGEYIGSFWRTDMSRIKRYALALKKESGDSDTKFAFELPGDPAQLKREADQTLLYLGLVFYGPVARRGGEPSLETAIREADVSAYINLGGMLYGKASELSEHAAERKALDLMSDHFGPWTEVLSHVPEHEAFGRMVGKIC